MLESKDIQSVVTEQARRLLVSRPDLRAVINKLVFDFRSHFGTTKVSTVSDIFDLCGNVDANLGITPEVNREIAETRQEIRDLLIHAFYGKERSQIPRGDMEATREVLRLENLAQSVAQLVALLRGRLPSGQFDQQWICQNDKDLFEKLKEIITARDTRVQKWNEVADMLPADLGSRFDIKVVMSREKDLLVQIEPYKELAKKLGPEAIAEFLVSIGAVKERDFSRVVGILREYLGPVRVPKPSLDDLPQVPEGMLRLPSLKRWLFVRLRNHVYRELVKEEHDSGSVAVHKGSLQKIKAKIRGIVEAQLNGKHPEHKEMLDAVVTYFEEALSLNVPARMVESLQDKQGQTHFVPSLRQRMAMLEIRGTGTAAFGLSDEDKSKSRNRRKLIEFFMGKGKTLSAVLGKEFVGAKKMLYCCPNVAGGKLVEELKSRFEKKYYKAGKAPTVGVIKAGMTEPELNAALGCEIVIFPYSMFGSEVGGKRIADHLKEKPFDYMVVDEIHYARKDYGRNTQTVFEMATGIPDLYEKGHVIGLTGNSTPNRPDDIVPQLRLWDSDAFREIASVRGAVRSAGPVALRNAVADFVFLVDEPEDWEKYVRTEMFELNGEERGIYDAIKGDEDMTLSEKLRKLYLCAMNPSLFAPTANVESAYLEKLTESIDEALGSCGKVVVAENAFKHGLLRDLEPEVGNALVEKIRAHVGGRAEVYVIDGNTPEKERSEIFKKSLEADRKMVIVAMGDIIRVGIDLSHISRCIALNPCWNKPDLAQLVKRFAREGNEQAQVKMLVPIDTVLEGILEHSQEKDAEITIFKHGGALTDDDLALLERDDFSSEVVVTRGRIYIGTIIRNATLTDKQKLNRMFDYMANLGEEGLKEFVDQYGEEFARIYTKVWERGYGGNNGRFTAGLFKTLEDKGLIPSAGDGPRIGDLGCGHMALENTFVAMGETRPRVIFNLDLNGHLLEAGKTLLKTHRPNARPMVQNGSFTDMRKIYPDANFDAINISMSLYCTKLNDRKKDSAKDERVRTLCEFNRVLRDGGIGVLTLPKDSCSPEEFQSLVTQLEHHFGFEILRDYTGSATSTDTVADGTNRFENHVVVFKKIAAPNLNGLDLSSLKFTRETKKKKPRERALVSQQPRVCNEDKANIHTAFRINASDFSFDFGVAEKQKQEAEFLGKVDAARACFKELYEKRGKSLVAFNEEDKGALILHNLTPISTGSENPAFIHGDDPVYPKRLWYLYNE